MAREDSIVWMIINGLLKWLKSKNAPIGIVGTIVLLGILAYIFSAQADAFPAADPFNINPPTPDITGPDNAKTEEISVSGYATEGRDNPEHFDLLGETIWGMEVTLTAQDEPNDIRRRFTNAPDSFEVEIVFPDGDSDTLTGSASNSAPMVLTKVYNWTSEGGKSWIDPDTGTGNSVDVRVTCTNAGDQSPLFAPFGFRVTDDDGNQYTLSVFYLYTLEEDK